MIFVACMYEILEESKIRTDVTRRLLAKEDVYLSTLATQLELLAKQIRDFNSVN